MYEQLIPIIFEDSSPPPSDLLIAQIRLYFDQLAPLQQDLLRQRYKEEMSVKNIAVRTSRSESSVRRHLTIAVHHLRKSINPNYREELQKVHTRFREQ